MDPARRRRPGLDGSLRVLLNFEAVGTGPLVEVEAVTTKRPTAHGAP